MQATRLKFRQLSVIVGFAVLTSVLGSALSAAAGEKDHDRARDALKAGEVVPLDRVLSKVERMFNGSILEVELREEEREAWGGDGESVGEHAGKGKATFPGVGPVDSPATDLSDKHKPPSNSDGSPDGSYVEGEGAVAGHGAKGNSIFVYKVELLSPQGNVLRIKFNAKSMKILGISGRDQESARKRR